MADDVAVPRTDGDRLDDGRDEADIRVQVNRERGYGHFGGKIAQGGRTVGRVIASLRSDGRVGRPGGSPAVIGDPFAARFAMAVRTAGGVTHFQLETGPGTLAPDRRELADAHAGRHEHRQGDQDRQHRAEHGLHAVRGSNPTQES